MLALNWTLITFLVVGIFAISGFYKGWWKEAITNFFLTILVFLLMFPDIAQWVINRFNDGLRLLWDLIPATIKGLLGLGVTPQFNASSSGTWIIILLLFLGLAILISRLGLSNRVVLGVTEQIAYTPTSLGSFLGGLLGGLNGFLIINLIQEYITGTFLPESNVPATEIAMASSDTVAVASSGVGIRLTDLPRFTNLDNIWAWLIIGFGVLIALVALKRRSWGYARYQATGKK